MHRSTKKSGKHPGRQKLPANLPRVEWVLPCPPDQRVCKRCGKETVVIGYEESFRLDVEPAKYFVLVVESCRRLQVRVREYFSTILPGLGNPTIRCVAELTPAAWVARHSWSQATGVSA